MSFVAVFGASTPKAFNTSTLCSPSSTSGVQVATKQATHNHQKNMHPHACRIKIKILTRYPKFPPLCIQTRYLQLQPLQSTCCLHGSRVRKQKKGSTIWGLTNKKCKSMAWQTHARNFIDQLHPLIFREVSSPQQLPVAQWEGKAFFQMLHAMGTQAKPLGNP